MIVCNLTLFSVLLLQQGGWVSSQNAAGMEFSSPDAHTSQAVAWASVAEGGLVNYYQSDKSWSWGALTRSLYRVDDRTTLQGEVSYKNETGQNMSGSVWIDPTDMPFDLIEYNEGNAGEKQLEQYRLMGAVSHRLSSHWNLGARIDFQAANYAKRRDLRHQNRKMGMLLSPSVTYQPTTDWRIGICYLFDRQVEGVSFNLAGTSGDNYYTLVSYGAFYGIKQLATSLDGYASTSNGMLPLTDRRQGGALQCEWKPSDRRQWFNELKLLVRDGYYGRESNYSVVYTNHEGKEVGWNSDLRFVGSGQRQHHCILAVDFATLTNQENLYNEVQKGGGENRIEYYDRMKRLERKLLTARLLYTLQTGGNDQQPRWTLQAGANYWMRRLHTIFYPTYRDQDLQQFKLELQAAHFVPMGKCSWQLSLAAGWQWGSGQALHEGISTSGTVKTYAVSADRYLYQEYEFLTIRQWQLSPAIRFNLPRQRQGLQPYLQVEYHRRQSIGAKYITDNHHSSTALHIGCNF